MSDETWPDSVLPIRATFAPPRTQPASPAAPGVSPRVTRRPGTIWRGSAEFGLLDGPKWGRLTALIDRVDGSGGVIEVPAFDRPRPATWNPAAPAAPDTATIGAIGLTGEQRVEIDGLTPNVAQLGPGDRFSLAGRLYRISDSEPVVNNANGTATVNFFPPLREDVLPGDEVRLTRPVCRMRLTPGQDLSPLIEKPMRGRISIEFMEADVPSTASAFARVINLFDFITNTLMPAEIGA